MVVRHTCMAFRRLLIPAGLGLFFLASALVALNLNGSQPGGDNPVTATSHPAQNLRLTVTLSHGRLIPARPLTLHVELTNTGAVAVPLPADGSCPFMVPLRLELLDTAGHVVWSQPVPMIACPELQQPPTAGKLWLLNPGETRMADACFQLATDLNWSPNSQCVALTLAAGTYRVAGTNYGFALPVTEFRLSR